MARSWDSVRGRLRAWGRPVVAAARKALATPQPPSQLQWVRIQQGPAEGCQILMPWPSHLARNVISNQYEPEVVAVAQDLVAQDAVCWDIGGHYGVFALILARLARSGQVHSFEPQGELADRISRSAAQSNLAHLKVHALAVADRPGRRELCRPTSLAGDDSMAYLSDLGGVDTDRSRQEYPTFGATAVDCVTLDSLDLPDPQLIKIDAEGAEAAILAGGQQLLRRHRPRLLIETHGVIPALGCAGLLGPIGYRGLAVGRPSLMMSVCWIHVQDSQAWAALHRPGRPAMPVVFAGRG